MFKLFLIPTVGLSISIMSATGSLQSGEPQAQRFTESKDGLELRIEMDKKAYGFLDDPIITISLKNVGEEPLCLYKKTGWGVSSSFFLAIRESRGRWLQSALISDIRHHAPFPERDFITLPPGEEFVLKKVIAFETERVTLVGTYDLTVWYHSPVSEKDAPKGMNVFTKEKGTLQSKPVTFTVVQ